MDRTILERTPTLTREIITHDSEAPGTFHMRTAQDVEPVIDLVSTLRDINRTIGHRRSTNMVPVAEIPLTVYEQAAREGWLHDKKKWRLWVNDPQNKPLRITDGRF